MYFRKKKKDGSASQDVVEIGRWCVVEMLMWCSWKMLNWLSRFEAIQVFSARQGNGEIQCPALLQATRRAERFVFRVFLPAQVLMRFPNLPLEGMRQVFLDSDSISPNCRYHSLPQMFDRFRSLSALDMAS